MRLGVSLFLSIFLGIFVFICGPLGCDLLRRRAVLVRSNLLFFTHILFQPCTIPFLDFYVVEFSLEV